MALKYAFANKRATVESVALDRVVVRCSDAPNDIETLMGISKPHNVKVGDSGILSYHNGLYFYKVDQESL